MTVVTHSQHFIGVMVLGLTSQSSSPMSAVLLLARLGGRPPEWFVVALEAAGTTGLET
jgi:hypothetical protein